MGVRDYFTKRRIKKLSAEKQEIESRTTALLALSKLQEIMHRGEKKKEPTKKEIRKDLKQNIRDIGELERLMRLEAQIKELELRNNIRKRKLRR